VKFCSDSRDTTDERILRPNCKFFCSAGGLVTAVAPVVVQGRGLWVGWPGVQLDDPNEPIPESDPSDNNPTAGLKSDQVSKGRRVFFLICSFIPQHVYLHTVCRMEYG
jgi:trehalose-6-phosphate synthase